MISRRVIEERRLDEGSIEGCYIKRLCGGVGCFNRLGLFKITAITRSPSAAHMKTESDLRLSSRLKTVQAGLSAQTGPDQHAVYENPQYEKQGNPYTKCLSIFHQDFATSSATSSHMKRNYSSIGADPSIKILQRISINAILLSLIPQCRIRDRLAFDLAQGKFPGVLPPDRLSESEATPLIESFLEAVKATPVKEEHPLMSELEFLLSKERPLEAGPFFRSTACSAHPD